MTVWAGRLLAALAVPFAVWTLVRLHRYREFDMAWFGRTRRLVEWTLLLLTAALLCLWAG
ncbi:hypothetical protein [Bifidobacterium myosotis]|uniref:Uncharacterized protein n=1 Tax=Bifidobacterium myosotis TaxID=1630166 RepID=A0A5M9ZG58_9BIFI|nr:hypothetical protein [Bifidobacterium myosotis]KAA8825378.1 hypothetical protein EMO91_12500 [Bifidobacterium myosotis]